MDILLLGKQREDFYFKNVIDFTLLNFPDTRVVLAKPGEAFPHDLTGWKGDYLISYLCPWVIPSALLKGARTAAINFHPATPDYPGTGCTNFAIYDNVDEYGVMCHHMAAAVDSGKVIAVRRFPVFPSDTVFSLTQRCYAHMLVLYYEVLSLIILGKPLPESSETWSRPPYRRKDLESLKRIDPDMPQDEIHRRVRATTYPGFPGAYVEIDGMRFEYSPHHNESVQFPGSPSSQLSKRFPDG